MWGQGDGDTGSDRDGGARGLDGTARRCRDLQLQLQWGVNLCWALGTEQGWWRVTSQLCSLVSPRGGGGGSGSAL